MTAEVKRIRPDVPSDPKMLLGMLQHDSHRMKHMAAIIVWDDDTYQLVNDAMSTSQLAMALLVLQKDLLRQVTDD